MTTSTPNLVKISQIVAELWRFFFKMADGRHLGFSYTSKMDFVAGQNDVIARYGPPMSTTVPNLVEISQMAVELLRFSVFQNGGWPSSWILIHVKNGVTAHCGLSISTTMPNFVTLSQPAAEL